MYTGSWEYEFAEEFGANWRPHREDRDAVGHRVHMPCRLPAARAARAAGARDGAAGAAAAQTRNRRESGGNVGGAAVAAAKKKVVSRKGNLAH